jgi:hypothetical protein
MNQNGFVAVTFLLLGSLGGQELLAADGRVLPLPTEDRLAIEESFGTGVIGQAVPAPALQDPALYLDLAPGSRTYRIVGAGDDINNEQFRWTVLRSGPGKPVWRYDAGKVESGFIEREPDGSFVLTGVQESGEQAITKYDPPEPFLIKDLNPGDQRRIDMAVRVYNLAEPSELIHEGSLEVIYRYVGAYRLTVPAGTYDAVLLKSTFSGKIGPAELQDIQYRFFAPGVGLAATIEKRDVSALVIYNAHTRSAKLFAGKP